mmetsp:Transcript_7735/g.13274  ORF Transcript_7735/g.13274 Transcript_7735/m.13274 type:complete len:118 (-) Transcript_7735:51-404(-)
MQLMIPERLTRGLHRFPMAPLRVREMATGDHCGPEGGRHAGPMTAMHPGAAHKPQKTVRNVQTFGAHDHSALKSDLTSICACAPASLIGTLLIDNHNFTRLVSCHLFCTRQTPVISI